VPSMTTVPAYGAVRGMTVLRSKHLVNEPLINGFEADVADSLLTSGRRTRMRSIAHNSG